MTKINIGDRVAYSATFLRSTGQYTGEVPFMRGTVTKVLADMPGWRLVEIGWDRKWSRVGPATVNDANLVLERNIAAESVR